MNRKRFAILKMGESLRLIQFEHKEEWRDAVTRLENQDIPFVVLKFNEQANHWYQMEVER